MWNLFSPIEDDHHTIVHSRNFGNVDAKGINAVEFNPASNESNFLGVGLDNIVE